jgi:hypothetical protein
MRKESRKFLLTFFFAFAGNKFDGGGSLQNRNNETSRHDNLQLLYRRGKANHLGTLGVASNRENENSSSR